MSGPDQRLCLRVMTEADLTFADSLRGIVGWNQTIRDWKRLLACEPRGCFIAEWDGAPVGTATTTRYGAELAWIGMLLVNPDVRGRGVGRALLEHCLDHLRGTRCVKLDATPLGKTLYDKLGFQVEWPLTRWEGKDRNDALPAALHDPKVILPWDRASLSKINSLDSRVFGVCRTAMLDRLAAESSVALEAATESGGLNGYGLLRAGSKASYLGPVVAETSAVGGALIGALLDQEKGRPIYWDVPDVNGAAASLAKQLGFAPQRHLIRMFVGTNGHPGDPKRCFGIADPSIG